MNTCDSSTRPRMTERMAGFDMQNVRMVPEWRNISLKCDGYSTYPTPSIYLLKYGWVSQMTMATFQGSGITSNVLGPVKRAAEDEVQDTTPKRLRGASPPSDDGDVPMKCACD